MSEDLKNDFYDFVQSTLNLPRPGIASTQDYSRDEFNGLKILLENANPQSKVPAGSREPIQPRQMLDGLKSIIVVAIPNYMSSPLDVEQCRTELLGSVSPIHVSTALQKKIGFISASVCNFLHARGFTCRPAPPTISIKIMAARCGVGYYGKNSMIINPGNGSWLSLNGYVTDAPLEPDDAVRQDCGTCDLCVKACPAQALQTPYSCEMYRCLNFQLQNKEGIPKAKRLLLRNFLTYGACRICRDVCPENRNLSPVVESDIPPGVLNPDLLELLDIDENRWKENYGSARLALIMPDKIYLIRNALIALGNFRDQRAVRKTARLLESGDPRLQGYAAWALGRIGGSEARSYLVEAHKKDHPEALRNEIEDALHSC